MFIRPGDFIKIRPRDQDLWDRIKIPLFMVEQIVGDIPTIKVLKDCVIVSSDGSIYPLSDFEITWVNGRNLLEYDPDLKRIQHKDE